MKQTITPTDEITTEEPIYPTMSFDLKVTIEAQGHRREDGLTAAEVRQEIKEREGADGS